MLMSKLKLLIPVSAFAIAMAGCGAKKEAALVGIWQCPNHILEFSAEGTVQVTQLSSGLKWARVYAVIDSPQYWGELKAESAPVPLNEYRYMRAEPTIVKLTSMAGLNLLNDRGETMQCSWVPPKS